MHVPDKQAKLANRPEEGDAADDDAPDLQGETEVEPAVMMMMMMIMAMTMMMTMMSDDDAADLQGDTEEEPVNCRQRGAHDVLVGYWSNNWNSKPLFP